VVDAGNCQHYNYSCEKLLLLTKYDGDNPSDQHERRSIAREKDAKRQSAKQENMSYWRLHMEIYRGMTYASNFPQTLVSLARQLLCSPTSSHAIESVALCDSNAVDHLVLLEDGVDGDWLLKQAMGESNFVGNASTIDLDLHQVGLLLLERRQADLSVSQNANDTAVLLDALKLASD
jgi:hypothetical protein